MAVSRLLPHAARLAGTCFLAKAGVEVAEFPFWRGSTSGQPLVAAGRPGFSACLDGHVHVVCGAGGVVAAVCPPQDVRVFPHLAHVLPLQGGEGAT